MVLSHILIGFSEKDFTSNKLLGTTKKSYAYKSDGKVLNGTQAGEDFGPKYEKNDVIGCGLILPQRMIFFTLNGRFLGKPFPALDQEALVDFYPCVCL